MQERKYYEAYDDRYRQVHGKSLKWFSGLNSKIVDEVIEKYNITTASKLLEIGCGEGRDAIHLLRNGYHLLATDISPAAIEYCRKHCPEYPDAFQVLNCLADRAEEAYDFIYAIAVLHMLILDEDRAQFYRFIYDQLSDTGIALICTMGDGKEERGPNTSDVRKLHKNAFKLETRLHEETGKTIRIASTSCRKVSFETIHGEIASSNLEIVESGLTSMEPDFPVVMFAVVKRKEV